MPFLTACCCVVPPPCRICVWALDGCRQDIPPRGTTLTLKQNGAALASYTLSASGESYHCFTGLAYGAYTVAAAPPNTRYATPADLAVTLDATTCRSSLGFTLNPAPGYACMPSPCCFNTTGPAPYLQVTPWATLYLNDGFGTVPLTGNGQGYWVGECTRVSESDCTGAQNVAVPVRWEVGCQLNPLGWAATPSIKACRASPDPYDPYQYTYDYAGGYLNWAPGNSGLLTPGPTCPPAAVSASGTVEQSVYAGVPPYGVPTGIGHIYGIRPPDNTRPHYYCLISLTLSS